MSGMIEQFLQSLSRTQHVPNGMTRRHKIKIGYSPFVVAFDSFLYEI